MKTVCLWLLVLLAIAVGIVALGNWRYVRGSVNDIVMLRRFHTAQRRADDLAKAIKPEHKYKRINFFVWPKDGILILFEGSVATSNDLFELKSLVEQRRGKTPVRWKVNISTNGIE
jgi:hypothetical protein